jgi:predicted transcriptional regulator
MIDFACKRFGLDEVIKCSLSLTRSEFNIVNYLLKKDRRIGSLEIARDLRLDVSTVQRALKNLSERKIVIRSQTNLSKGGYVYTYQINDKKVLRNMIKKIVHGWVERVDESLDRW